MSARGHRTSTIPMTGLEVGGTAGLRAVGVGDYTVAASQDPAERVLFDMDVQAWLEAGMVREPRMAHGLLAEREVSTL